MQISRFLWSALRQITVNNNSRTHQNRVLTAIDFKSHGEILIDLVCRRKLDLLQRFQTASQGELLVHLKNLLKYFPDYKMSTVDYWRIEDSSHTCFCIRSERHIQIVLTPGMWNEWVKIEPFK